MLNLWDTVKSSCNRSSKINKNFFGGIHDLPYHIVHIFCKWLHKTDFVKWMLLLRWATWPMGLLLCFILEVLKSNKYWKKNYSYVFIWFFALTDSLGRQTWRHFCKSIKISRKLTLFFPFFKLNIKIAVLKKQTVLVSY